MLWLMRALQSHVRSIADRVPMFDEVVQILFIMVYLGVGILVTCALESKVCESDMALAAFDASSGEECTEPLTFVDGFYFAVVTLSTVGYGDFSPSSTSMRVFTVLYILFGCARVFVMLSDLFVNVLERYRQACLAFIDRFDRSAKHIDTTGDGVGDTAVVGRSKGLSGRGLDLSGDGQVDFVAPPGAVSFWAQELLPALLLWVVLQLVSAGIFMACQSGLTFGEALYHCLITATTVGYGDVSLTTQPARLWASAHILVSVSWLAALIGQIDQCHEFRLAQLERAVLLTRPLDRSKILELDHDGQGVDKLEFVVGMLQILGVELCGERLRWDDVRPFITKFDELDVSKTGRISKQDLETFYEQDREEQQRVLEQIGWSRDDVARAKEHYEEGMLKRRFYLAKRNGMPIEEEKWPATDSWSRMRILASETSFLDPRQRDLLKGKPYKDGAQGATEARVARKLMTLTASNKVAPSASS